MPMVLAPWAFSCANYFIDIKPNEHDDSNNMGTPQKNASTHQPVQPWNNWYHVMCHTYGTWLPGDPRGFRTRHHREHCDGDYKNPPKPGQWEQRHAQAKSLMK